MSNMQKNMNDFAVFILTHGRADNVLTYETLKRHGYTGKIYLIIDDEDESLEDYKSKYKDEVVVFSKELISKTFDAFDNSEDRRTIVYARNACFQIARELKIKYFLQLDDDYTNFYYSMNTQGEYLSAHPHIKSLDKVLEYLLDYYKSVKTLKTLCMAQGGDFIGGANSSVFRKKLARKAMNSFICSTDRKFNFIGRINEDVNTYTSYQSKGNLFLTVANLRLEQKRTQQNEGGMSEMYLDSGTYIKSFFTVICAPSCTKIRTMGVKSRRLHHTINWKKAVPCIVREEHRKVVA